MGTEQKEKSGSRVASSYKSTAITSSRVQCALVGGWENRRVPISWLPGEGGIDNCAVNCSAKGTQPGRQLH